MNRMIGSALDSTSSITWRSRFSNSPFTLAPACIRPMSSAAQRHAAQHRRHVAVDDPLGEPLDHRGLADAGLTHQDRMVLAAAQQDVDELANLGVAPDDPVDLAAARLFGQVDREFDQRLALADRPRAGIAAGRRPPVRRRPGSSRPTTR